MTFDQGSGRLASGRTAGTSSARTLALKPLAECATLERGQVRRISVLRCSRPAARSANISLIDCRDTVAPGRALPWSFRFVSLGLDRSFHISVRHGLRNPNTTRTSLFEFEDFRERVVKNVFANPDPVVDHALTWVSPWNWQAKPGSRKYRYWN
jgi:hypothetical protein